LNVYEKIIERAGSDRIALRYRGETRTYGNIAASMLNWSNYLKKNCDDNTPIIIYGHKDIDIIPCALGCSLAGHPYVPIDVTFPQNRASLVIDEINPKIIVDFTGGLTGVKRDAIGKERIAEIFAESDASDAVGSLSPDENDVCYILFTSGSTGSPKGVEIQFRNLQAYMRGFRRIFYAGDGTHTVLNSLSYSFDVSWGYVYPSLYFGYTLHTVDKKMLDNLGDLFEDLKTSGVQTVMSTPSIMDMCAVSQSFDRRVLPDVKRFLFCGEILTDELAKTLKERFVGAEIINTYGPTETTILVTEATVTDEMIASERSIPIGGPLSGTEIRLIGEYGEILPDDERGQLQIIGDSVGPGYFKRPGLTEKAFFIDPKTGKRGYNTGDICYRHGGQYYFCCRNDFQVKLNGFRIELGDVENNLTKIPYISRAAVIPVTRRDKVDYLAAFVVLSERTESSDARQRIAIKKDLGAFAASYMIPRKIVIKESFPADTSGKTDRKALAAELAAER
jgi:D-alanine--poly(phosphoribitol) ligase subunit 1